MPKNTAQDLIDNLFCTLEDLNDEEKMKNPITREKTMQIAEKKSMVAREITNAANAQLKFIKEFGGKSEFLGKGVPEVQPKRIGGDE
jgi:hypothetical protein